MKKTKIAFILASLRAGGAEKITTFLADNLPKEKFEVVVILLDPANPFFSIHPSLSTIILNKIGLKNAFPKLLSTIKEIKPDVVFCSNMKINITMAFAKHLLPSSIKWVGRETAITSLAYPLYYRYPKLMMNLAWLGYRSLDKIIAQSQYMKEDLVKSLRYTKDNLVVINNPVIIPTIKISKNKNDRPYLLSVGRLHHVKGYDRVLQSLATLDINYQYHILGEGEERTTLEKLIKTLGLEGKVFLHGQVMNTQEHYLKADLLLMGSIREGFPNVVLEAGSVGLPTVAFNSPGGIREIIVDGINGFLVKDGDLNGFNKTILKALKHLFDQEQIIDDTSQRFGKTTIIKKYSELFLNL